MKEISDLIQNLPNASIQNIARSLLKHSIQGSSDTLLHRFFILFRKSGNKDEKFYSQKLFGNLQLEYMRVLKHRLKRKIIEAITSENNILRNNDLDKIDKELYLCNKYLLTAKMLLRISGNSKSALELIKKAEKKGRRYEFNSLVRECLSIKKFQTTLIKSPKDFKSLNEQIEQIEFAEKLTSKANDYYYKFIVNARQMAINLSEKESQQHLLNAIFELKKDLEFTRSSVCKYFILLMEMEYYDKLREYEAGLNVSTELKRLLLDNDSIYKKERLGTVEINLAYFLAKLHKFNDSLAAAKTAIRNTIPQSNNNLLYKEQEIMILINQLEFKLALNKINQLINYTLHQENSLRHGRYKFLKAVILTKLLRTKEAMTLIHKNKSLEEDLSGWEFSKGSFK